jgi:hypothetical protein
MLLHQATSHEPIFMGSIFRAALLPKDIQWDLFTLKLNLEMLLSHNIDPACLAGQPQKAITVSSHQHKVNIQNTVHEYGIRCHMLLSQ